MSRLNSFLILLAALALLLFLQASGIFQLGHVRANLLVAFFIFLVAMRLPAWQIFGLLFVFAGLTFLDTPAAGKEALVFSAVIAASFVLRRMLSGRALIDFALLLVFASASFFYAIPLLSHFAKEGFALSGIAFPPSRTLFLEMGMNFFAGLLMVLVGGGMISRISRS